MILAGAIMKSLALAYVIADGSVFQATVAAAFVPLPWMIPIALIISGTTST